MRACMYTGTIWWLVCWLAASIVQDKSLPKKLSRAETIDILYNIL